MLFDLSVSERAGWTVVRVIGELDLATAPRLRQRLGAVVAGGARHVAVDLGPTDFVDSVGLGVLIGGLRRCRSVGGRFVVVCDEARLLDLLALVGLDAVFTVVPTLAELDPVAAGSASPVTDG